MGPSTSALTASTTSIGSAGAPQRDIHSPVGQHHREQSPLLHHHHMLNQGGSFEVIRPGVTFSSQGSQFTIQATPLTINQYSSSSGGTQGSSLTLASGSFSQGAHTRSTSALGQPQVGSLSGPAGTPCYSGSSTNQGFSGPTVTLPNLAVDFVGVDKAPSGSDSETVTTSTTTTTFLQLPED